MNSGRTKRLRWLDSEGALHSHTGRHRLLVHIQPAHPLDQPFHGCRLLRRPEGLRSRESARRAQGQQCRVPTAPTSDYSRTRGTKFSRSRASGAR